MFPGHSLKFFKGFFSTLGKLKALDCPAFSSSEPPHLPSVAALLRGILAM